jgi:FkbM family methyltransferase
MYVEECCEALLSYILPEVDPNRLGITIEIGVGTFHFYCSLFQKLGFESIAVEPIPNDDLKQVCNNQNIRLIESCITKIDGTTNIYMGTWKGEKNTNLCSTRPDWWGTTSESKEVSSISLITLFKKLTTPTISCMKVDVEGTEVDIIEQFINVPKESLPLVLMFEYGGGAIKSSKQGGWSSEIYNSTLKCLETLKSLDYQEIIVIDSSEGFLDKIYDLSSMSSFDEIFPETCDYGNIIATRDPILTKLNLHTITSQYRDNSQLSSSSAKNLNMFDRILNKIKQYNFLSF